MIFLRIGRSVNRYTRSAFNKTPFSGGYGVELAVLNGLASENGCIARSRGGSGFMRSYLTSIGAGKHVLNGGASSEFNSSRLIRLYCSETPKKRSKKNKVFCHDAVMLLSLQAVMVFDFPEV
ncbi:unnamed protein product [Fraxinus pennsylvanica]|uniref:Uncharacterized protein n=1 Tax=Fraxinus pennsylvanica TaxID=56036 RepID=A0AAD1Z697_9LAMI|nr:unnamed protein product [Fraxinus pennsylvanica]